MRTHNVVIAGATGSGKTTFLNALLAEVPHDQRVLTIEDTAELQVQTPNYVGLEAMPDRGITIRALVRLALRFRPDWIIVGAGLALAVTLALGGCATGTNLKHADKDFAATQQQTHDYIQQMQAPHPTAAVQPVEISDEQWVDTQPLRSTERRLPSNLNCSIAFKPVVAMDLLRFAQQITQDCRIPVRVTADALAAVNVTGATLSQGSMAPQAPLTNMPSLSGGLAALNGGSTVTALSMSMAGGGTLAGVSDYVGPVAGLLDLVTARNGLSWRYYEKTQSISIFYLDTRTFRIDAFPTVTSIQTTIQTGTTASSSGAGGSSGGGGSSSSSGGGGGGVTGMAGSAQTTTTSMNSNLYSDLENTIKSFLTPAIGRVAISASTGTVSVTDTPDVLDRIGALLDHENATLTKQIVFHVKILSITSDTSDEVGLNWSLVYKALAGKYGFNFSTPFQPAVSAGTLGASVLSGPMKGSNVVLSALSSLGNVRVVTSPSVTTLNLQPAPVQIARQIGYIATAQSPTIGLGGVTTSPGGLTPGFVTAGFNMSLVPRLLEDDSEMIVQYSINISELNQIRSVSAAGTTIEFPDLNQRMFSDQVRLRSGETLILHGFEQDSSQSNRQGMGSPFAWLLGGGMKTSRTREAIVILITPEVQIQGGRQVAQAAAYE